MRPLYHTSHRNASSNPRVPRLKLVTCHLASLEGHSISKLKENGKHAAEVTYVEEEAKVEEASTPLAEQAAAATESVKSAAAEATDAAKEKVKEAAEEIHDEL